MECFERLDLADEHPHLVADLIVRECVELLIGQHGGAILRHPLGRELDLDERRDARGRRRAGDELDEVSNEWQASGTPTPTG